MLSFRTISPGPPPGQGREQPTPSPIIRNDKSTSSHLSQTPRLDQKTNLGSPGKQQSPLRHSVSYDHWDLDDDIDVQYSSPSFKRTIDSANSKIGRSNMSYTGDYKKYSTPTTRPQTASDASTPKNASAAGSSRFAFFTTAFMGLSSPAFPAGSGSVSMPQDDDLFNLNIDHALAQDDASPAALLHRFQIAYQQRTVAYQELKAETSVQVEEQDEAETRIRNLKVQLQEMARKAVEQETAMKGLMEELSREKKLRMEERQNKGISMLSEASSISEDLAVEEDQQRMWKRQSDVGFETDDDGHSFEEASVFSRPRSPTADISLEYPVPRIKTPFIAPPQAQRNLRTPSQPTAFQKLFGAKQVNEETRCQNCEGQDSSVAWDTVNLLKGENRGLKVRVGELESVIEGALDTVNGLGL